MTKTLFCVKRDELTMTTIQDAALKSSRAIAWRISTLVASLVALLIFGVLTWNTYFRVEAAVSAISGQLAHLLTVGDTFELKTQLMSLSSGGLVDHFVLKEPSGIIVAGDGAKEGFEQNAGLIQNSHPEIHSIDGRLHLVRTFTIPVRPDQQATLIVSKEIHLEVFLLVVFVQIFLFFLVNTIFQRYVLRFANDLTDPISKLASSVKSANGYAELATNESLKSALRYQELNQTLDSFLRLLQRLETEQDLRRAAERDATLSQVAAQVAHDIRSPLQALGILLTKSTNKIPEIDRQILRSSTQRINDIANNLLSTSKALTIEQSARDDSSRDSESVMLIGLVDSVVSEKRVQYRNKENVAVEADLTHGYGLFIQSSAIEVSRAISNLINNGVEAIGEKAGSVIVRISDAGDRVCLSVSDNGTGIPGHIIERLGRERVTYGKSGTDSGSGLGVLHASKTAQAAGGELKIRSDVGKGSTIELWFPKAPPPPWFVERLTIKSGLTIVSVDDDETIHQVWSEKLKEVGNVPINHVTHSSLEKFESWVRQTRPENTLYLVDFEFSGQDGNGLEAIDRLGIARSSILISSRYEERSVGSRAAALGVRMVPKSLATFLPVESERNESVSPLTTI